MMNNYREKHPRCRYCKYKKGQTIYWYKGFYTFYYCDLKNKLLYDENSSILRKVKGIFCKGFEASDLI